ncbi:MAG: hypothetical protein LC733_03550, partial [Actinobacteria bacterium]|nr:hypothetical protein [Actinomycetota bacterium]
IFSTGPLTVSTFAGNVAGDDHAGFVQASTLVQTVNAGAGLATATSIASSCRAGADGSTGATVIQGGMLNGQPFGSGTPEPNTVIPVEGLGTVTLNEQVRSDVPGSSTIVVNAVHARYAGGPGGILPQDQSAEAIIGQVVCQAVGPNVNAPATTTTVPAPTTTTVPATIVPTAPDATITAPTVPVPTLPVSGGAERILGLALVALMGARLVWHGRGRRSPSG